MFSTLPNTLSVLRIALSPVFYALFTSGDPLQQQWSLAVFLVAALTDWYDGVLARRHNTVTTMGKFLDPLADKVLTSAAFIAFATTGMVAWWMVLVIVIRDIAITFLRSLAEARGAHITTSKSAQTKTFIQMAVLYYLLLAVVGRDVAWLRGAIGVDAFAALLDPMLVYVLMLAVTLITVGTGVQYLVDNRPFVRALLIGRRRVAD